MYYSIYDPERETYFYYVYRNGFDAELPGNYNEQAYLPWQSVRVHLPDNASPVGIGTEPRGIIAHPHELRRPAPRTTGQNIMLAGLVFAAKWVFFGGFG